MIVKENTSLREFAQKFSNIDFFLRLFPLQDDNLKSEVMEKELYNDYSYYDYDYDYYDDDDDDDDYY